MSFPNELSREALRRSGREDAVDQVLRDYFRAELPAPWPAWKTPAVVAAPRPGRSLFWGRFGLAASIALLLGSQLWLASFYRPPESNEAAGRSKHPVDVASKPQPSNPGTAPAAGKAPARPPLKNMR